MPGYLKAVIADDILKKEKYDLIRQKSLKDSLVRSRNI